MSKEGREVMELEEYCYLEEVMEDLSVEDMLYKAKSLVVTNEQAFCEITKIYKLSKDLEKKVEAERKTANSPDQARINDRNDRAKKLCDPLKEIQGLCKQRLEAYQALLERKRKEDEEERIKIAQMLDVEVPETLPAPKTTRGEGAIIFTTIEKRFEIEDKSKLPLDYLILDEEKVKRHLQLGVGIIPGLRIWEEKVTKIRTR